VITRAPHNAQWIGYGLHAWNQINDDFVEYSAATLHCLEH
jgi:hypothetical protein